MAIEIANKRIDRRGREIRKFVKFLNAYYEIPDDISLHVLNFPCVYDENLEPAFGLFYFDDNDQIRIEIANDFEWYEKIHREKFGKKFCTYMSLSHISHEFCHYVRYRDGKKYDTEHWIDHQASKILKEYVKMYSSIVTESYVDKLAINTPGDEYFSALNPVSFIRKKASLDKKIF